jgi:FkbM family methyltransferase
LPRFCKATDSPVILDCDANIGLAMLFFKRLYPKARISCFEADPTTAAVLQKNVDQNHLTDVTGHNLMLSNEEGEHSFFIDDVAGSLTMSSIPDRHPNGREIKVSSGRLSRFIERPVDLLKLDVEGAE